MVGRVRDLARRARRVGRDRARLSRRRDRREARRCDVWLLADCLAPGLLLAQGIGRLGNWWNQELFGKPTDLPWGLEIDATAVPVRRPGTTFHPTFLYELIWDFAMAAVLVYVIERRLRPRPPGVFAAYIALYCIGRFFEELLRIDPAHHIAGLRLNAWVSLIGIVAGVAWYVLSQRSDRPARPGRKKEKPAAPARKMTVPQAKRVRPPG